MAQQQARIPLGARVKILWDFVAESKNELSAKAGTELFVVDVKEEWIVVKDSTGNLQGSVPLDYVQVVVVQTPAVVPPVPPKTFAKSIVPETTNQNSTYPPLPPAFTGEASVMSTNPLFQQQQQQDQVVDDEDELLMRFQHLKSRINNLVEEEEEIPEAIVVGSEVPPPLPPPNVVEVPPLPPPNKPTEIEVWEKKKRQEEELARLELESQRRAEEMKRLAKEQAMLREQARIEEIEALKRNSSIFANSGERVNFLKMGEEKRLSALTFRNQKKFAECAKDTMQALKYYTQALGDNQVLDKAALLARMEHMIDKDLNLPPLVDFTNAMDVANILSLMVSFGYSDLEGLKQDMIRFRIEGLDLEKDGQQQQALFHFKMALQRLIVIRKILKAANKNADSVSEAIEEMLNHCESIKKKLDLKAKMRG